MLSICGGNVLDHPRDIGFFFYNGGGNSQDTAYKVNQMAAALAYPIVGVGIPKNTRLARLRLSGLGPFRW